MRLIGISVLCYTSLYYCISWHRFFAYFIQASRLSKSYLLGGGGLQIEVYLQRKRQIRSPFSSTLHSLPRLCLQSAFHCDIQSCKGCSHTAFQRTRKLKDAMMPFVSHRSTGFAYDVPGPELIIVGHEVLLPFASCVGNHK